MNKQPWIGTPWIDIVFILLPPFLSLLLVILLPSFFQNNKDMPVAGWVFLIILIDVAHVYSTLYRTYFDPNALQKQRALLWTIPFVSFVAGVLLYSINDHLFWRLLAYVAVFHFVRQQYGFMRVYSRKEQQTRRASFIDKLTIYIVTIYPILYWHFKGPRNFNWFVENDFVFVQSEALLLAATILYLSVLVLYVYKEAIGIVHSRSINIPKIAIITGTALSWYFGIVYFNGDMAFTLLNVVSHGIPYMALIWLYGRKNYRKQGQGTTFLKLLFSRYGIVLFLGLLALFAFIEEGLWDLALWKEHKTIFGTDGWRHFEFSDTLLSLIVPLLALPQITHYILDGFIWKIREDKFKWNNEVG
jgi:hypothetical protein